MSRKLKIMLLVALLALSQGAVAKDAILKVGDIVPDFQLIDQNAKQVALSQFKGKGVVLTFLYTTCPYPDKCPMIGKKLADLAELTETIGQEDQLQIMAITLDPARDKPSVLKAYARGLDKDYKSWSFLTGTETEITRVASAFGVLFWTENGVIEHNTRTVFIDSTGKLRVQKSGSDWRVGEFAAEIKPWLK